MRQVEGKAERGNGLAGASDLAPLDCRGRIDFRVRDLDAMLAQRMGTVDELDGRVVSTADPEGQPFQLRGRNAASLVPPTAGR